MDIDYFNDWWSQYIGNQLAAPEYNIVQDNFIEIESGQIRFIDNDVTNRPTCVLVVQGCAENYWKVVPFAPTKIPMFYNEYATGVEGWEVLQLWNAKYIEYDILKSQSYYITDIDVNVVNEVRKIYNNVDTESLIPEAIQIKRGPIHDTNNVGLEVLSALNKYQTEEYKNLEEFDAL